MRVAYLIITVASAVFYIMYKGDLSFILFAFLLALPPVLFLILLVCSLFLKITVYCDSPVTERGKAAVMKINIRNRSFLPISACSIRIYYSVTAPLEETVREKRVVSVPLGGRSSETVSISFLPKHCGTVEFFIKDISLNDLMCLSSLRKKIKFRGKITVLPQIYPITASIESRYVYSSESNAFSKEKPGDDPSEIFALREYRDGDRHNLIHWKLSSRSDNFIVKELSKPVGSRILIMSDFGGCADADGADRILETAAAISSFLTENGIAHVRAMPYEGYMLRTAEIYGSDSLYSEIAEISQNIQKLEFKSSIAYVTEIFDSSYIINGGFSRVIAVSERCGGDYADKLSALCGEAKLTIVCTSPAPELDREDPNASADYVFADAEKLSTEKVNLSI